MIHFPPLFLAFSCSYLIQNQPVPPGRILFEGQCCLKNGLTVFSKKIQLWIKNVGKVKLLLLHNWWGIIQNKKYSEADKAHKWKIKNSLSMKNKTWPCPCFRGGKKFAQAGKGLEPDLCTCFFALHDRFIKNKCWAGKLLMSCTRPPNSFRNIIFCRPREPQV